MKFLKAKKPSGDTILIRLKDVTTVIISKERGTAEICLSKGPLPSVLVADFDLDAFNLAVSQ